MIHLFNGHARLRCDECFQSDEFATKADAEKWASQRGWETIEKGGGEIHPFEDHVCDLCKARKLWAQVKEAA